MNIRRFLVSIVLAGYVALPAPAVFALDTLADSAGNVRKSSDSGLNRNAENSPSSQDRDAAGPDTTEDLASSCSDHDEITATAHWNTSFLVGSLSPVRHFITPAEPSFPIKKPPQN